MSGIAGILPASPLIPKVDPYQVLDGIDPLPNADTAEGSHRKGLAGVAQQPQARHEHLGYRPADRGDEGLGATISRILALSRQIKAPTA